MRLITRAEYFNAITRPIFKLCSGELDSTEYPGRNSIISDCTIRIIGRRSQRFFDQFIIDYRCFLSLSFTTRNRYTCRYCGGFVVGPESSEIWIKSFKGIGIMSETFYKVMFLFLAYFLILYLVQILYIYS